MEILNLVCMLLGILFVICYAHQYVYTMYTLIRRPKPLPEMPARRYGVLIAARNEEAVIGELLDSLRRQDYPQGMLDIFVVADNCTDGTADAARAGGAVVFERFNTSQVGKGYALQYLLERIDEQCSLERYDGYFVFDADNLLDEQFVREMNKCFTPESPVVTSYRNSKNFGDNWISSGYSLWFLREAGQINAARCALGTSSAVGGTGFLVSSELLRRIGGWKYFLLTEDLEFTVDMVLQGVHIAYCGSAVLYDEQPTKFTQSWWQRLRWSKGYLQILRQDGRRIFRGLAGRNAFACYDVAMVFLPAIVLSMAGLGLNIAQFVVSMTTGAGLGAALVEAVVRPLAGTYLLMFCLGVLTTAKEWRRICAPAWKKLAYTLSFPFFMMTYFPIAAAAMFLRVEWKPIRHSVRKNLEQVRAA